MKAIIEIELDNAAFGDSPAERLFEMENITEKLMANAARIMAVDVGDFVTAQDYNGNTVARMDIVKTKVKSMYGLENHSLWVTIKSWLFGTARAARRVPERKQKLFYFSLG